MKIAHLIYDLSPGGAERFVVDLSTEQIASGHSVTIVCLNSLEGEKKNYYRKDLSDSVEIVCLNGPGHLTSTVLVQLGLYFKKEKFDLIHAHTYPVVTYPISIFCKTPVVLTYHSVVDYYIQNPIFTRIDRFLFRKRRILPVTISSACHDSFEKAYGLSCDTVICNGRSRMNFTDEFGGVKAFIERINPSGAPVFVHVARFSKEKNQHMLYDSFKQLHDEGVAFILLMIGSGYPDSFKTIAENVPGIFVLGPKHNVADYLGVSDYFVMSSTFEGLPISLLEAMSMGCIPISTPAGGVVDVVRNDINGYLSNLFDSFSFANAVKRALSCHTVNKDIVIDDYETNYTIGVSSNRYLSLYLSAVK